MATNFSPCKGSYVLNQFPSNVMFAVNGFTYQPVERYRAIMALLFIKILTVKTSAELCAFWHMPYSHKVCNKETNEQMHSRKSGTRQDSNSGERTAL